MNTRKNRAIDTTLRASHLGADRLTNADIGADPRRLGISIVMMRFIDQPDSVWLHGPNYKTCLK